PLPRCSSRRRLRASKAPPWTRGGEPSRRCCSAELPRAPIAYARPSIGSSWPRKPTIVPPLPPASCVCVCLARHRSNRDVERRLIAASPPRSAVSAPRPTPASRPR
uniref:Uncharacterized protein n=1 Tax=Triticum urartu TaxID=4572 RepID=A0A8R7Q5Y0_TRIUA